VAIGIWGVIFTGYLLQKLYLWERILGFIAGGSLILATPLSDEIGFCLALTFILQHAWRARKLKRLAQED